MARKTKNTDTPVSAAKKPRSRRTPTSKATTVSEAASNTVRGVTASTTAEKPIAGKLGLIATAVTKPKGASIDDLTTATGWQPHTVRAALSRLRQRGIDAKLTTVDERKAYRVSKAGA